MSASAEQTGNLQQALAHAQRLLQRDPKLALEQADEILKAVPGHPAAVLVRGVALRDQGVMLGLQALPPRACPASIDLDPELLDPADLLIATSTKFFLAGFELLAVSLELLFVLPVQLQQRPITGQAGLMRGHGHQHQSHREDHPQIHNASTLQLRRQTAPVSSMSGSLRQAAGRRATTQHADRNANSRADSIQSTATGRGTAWQASNLTLDSGAASRSTWTSTQALQPQPPCRASRR